MDRNGIIDDVDRRIIETLGEQPRMTYRALAQTVGVSEPTIYARLRQLADAGVCEVRAQLDFSAFGYRCAMYVDFWVERDKVEEVAAIIAGIDEVLFVAIFEDDPRLLAVVAAPDHELPSHFVDRLRPLDELSRASVHIALRIHRYAWGYGKIDADRHDPLPIPPNCPLDQIDQIILEAMRRHPRHSNRQIAAMAGISEATVRRRLSGLQEAGVYATTLVCDPRFLGFHAWHEVRLMVPPGQLNQVAKTLAILPETMSLTHTTGDWNIRWFHLIDNEARLDEALRPIDPSGAIRNTMIDRLVMTVPKDNCDYMRILP